MNFLFGSWCPYNDLYSASIKVNFAIKDPKSGYKIAHSSFDKDNTITWTKTGSSLKTT